MANLSAAGLVAPHEDDCDELIGGNASHSGQISVRNGFGFEQSSPRERQHLAENLIGRKSWVWSQRIDELTNFDAVSPEYLASSDSQDTVATAYAHCSHAVAIIIARLCATLTIADRSEPLDAHVWERLRFQLTQYFLKDRPAHQTLNLRVVFPRGQELQRSRPFELVIHSLGSHSLQFALNPIKDGLVGNSALWESSFQAGFSRIWEVSSSSDASAFGSAVPTRHMTATKADTAVFNKARELALALRSDRILAFLESHQQDGPMTLTDLTSILVEGIAAQEALDNDENQDSAKRFNRHRMGTWFAKFYRRVFDVSTSLVGMVVASPLVALLALAIKADDPTAPIFYQQERCKADCEQESFDLYRMPKLRSMNPNAEADGKERLAAQNDERITRIGKFIRKTRLDEVPQLASVFRGHMSLIGHRPERLGLLKNWVAVIPYFEQRSLGGIKPGITGMAQTRLDYLGFPRPGTQLESFLSHAVVDFAALRNNPDAAQAQQLAMAVKLLHDLSDRVLSAHFADRIATDFLIVVRTVTVMFGRHGR